MNSLSHAFVGGTGNVGTTFAYNPASQVTSLTRSNDAYAQTAPANGTQSYTVNGRNQYTAVAGVAHTYDANGNLTSDGATTFLYDIENRLVSASGAKNATLRYDPLGRLYEVASGSSTRRFLYDGDALMSEYDAAGALTARYIHADDAGADDPLVWFDGLALRWLHPDHQGSIVALTNGSGQHYATNAYDAWGVPNATNVGRFQYTGQMWLAELGLYHYKARVYSPYLGRFLQTDPVGYDDQLNLYAYVANDPVNHTDPKGTEGWFTSHNPFASDEQRDSRASFGENASRALWQAETTTFSGMAQVASLFIAPEGALAARFGIWTASLVRAARIEGRPIIAGARAYFQRAAAVHSLNRSLTAGTARIRTFAGAGTNKVFRNAERSAERYGGSASDYAKISVSTRTASGDRVSIHAVQNVTTGKIYERQVYYGR